MSDWTNAVIGDRMAVDNQFSRRIVSSEFTNQEWGLIMTATDLEIENADDPEAARIVANTEKVPHVMPEVEKVRKQMGGMGGAPGGGGSSGGSSGGGGLLGSIVSALGLGGSGKKEQQRLEAADKLAQEYAQELQQHLEAEGKWEQVRIAYLE